MVQLLINGQLEESWDDLLDFAGTNQGVVGLWLHHPARTRELRLQLASTYASHDSHCHTDTTKQARILPG